MEFRDITMVLASASPRRRELLERMNWKFIVHPAEINEEIALHEKPEQMVCRLSALKARNVSILYPYALTIACDTVVALDGQIYGKPASPQCAAQMLRCLSGKVHQVYSGLCCIYQGRELCESVRTDVKFQLLSEQDIQSYVACGEPMDKAGSYGIQGLGMLFVQSLNGDYFNVVGLPMNLLGQFLQKFGFSLSDMLGAK